jgi:hypothetical protein
VLLRLLGLLSTFPFSSPSTLLQSSTLYRIDPRHSHSFALHRYQPNIMQFTKIFVVLAALASSVFAAPRKRELAQVITSCTEPNTVALTFVSRSASSATQLKIVK